MSIKVENLINLDRLTQYDGLIKNKIKEHSDIQASDIVSGHVKVDTGLSDTSTNPVQNKAVKNALDSKVPITRTVNGKALSSNISLSASDVGADPSGSSNSALSSAKSYTDAQVSTVNNTLTSHTGNTSNPHSVTKAQVGLGNVENKSSATIRGELTKTNVTNALGYTPYTPNEVDNKIATLETNIDWKETVATYSDIATTYPNPVDGWTVNVKDTDYTYRYNGTSWIAISANVIPKATNSIDGLLTKEDHTKYEDANSKKHTHDNKAVIDGITSTLVSNWNAAKTHADSAHARTDATKVEKSSTNGNIKINGTETVVYTHPSGTNPHGTTQSDVGLGNVNNTADKDKYVKGVIDYANTSLGIQIGYAGAGLTVDEATHIAAYTENGHKIKDLSFENLKTKLGLNGAEPNQNAFSNIVVGSTTIEADTKTDTLTLVGSNVTITPDAINDKITIGVASGSTSAKGIVQLTDSTSSTSTTTAATPKSVKSAYDLANTAKTAAANAQSTADSKVGSVSLSSGTNNGTLKLTVDGTATDNIAVKGLGSAAYTNTSAYATAAQGTKADNAMPRGGGEFTGAVTLNADPSTALGAATKQYVDAQITSKIAASDAMVFKGTLGSNGTVTAVPTTGVVKGDTYKVITAGTWAGSACKVGDLLIALTSGSVEANTTNWAYVPSGDEVTTSIKYSTTTHNLTTSAKTGAITLAEGATKQVDTSISAGSTSTKLPTSAAVASFVEGKGYTKKAFKNIAVGSVTVEADSNADTLTLEAGTNVTIGADAENDKITISAKDTTYSAGTGISLSGTTINHSNSIEAGTAQGNASKTLTYGGTFTIPTINYDAQGHITGKGTTTMTMPAVPTTVANATKLSNSRTISLTGAVTGSGTFDGSGDLSISTTVSHTHNYAGSSSAGGAANVALGLSPYTISNIDELNSFSSDNLIMKYAKASNCDIGWGSKDGLIISLPWSSTYEAQIAIDDQSNWMGIRTKNSGTWNNWSVLLSSTNYTSYVPTKTGSGASGTWGISITGNSATSTKLANARNFSITGGATAANVSFNGTGNVALNVTSLNAMTLNVASGDTLILDGTI